MPLTDEELFGSFNKDIIKRYNLEASDAYGTEFVSRVNRKIRNQSKAQWQAVQQEGVAIAKGLSKLMDREPADPDVQTLIARQHAWIENFYPVDADVFRGLGDLYTTNSEFRAHYDQYTPGLADFMCNAMTHYAETVLEVQRSKE